MYDDGLPFDPSGHSPELLEWELDRSLSFGTDLIFLVLGALGWR